MPKEMWFEVGKTQELEICDDVLDGRAMLEPTDGPRIRASHLHIECAPSTTDYIRVMFRDLPEPVEPVAASRPRPRWIALVAIGVAAIVVALVL